MSQKGKLAKDDDWQVREAVAQNPYCPVEALAVLGKDDDWTVRCAVAENANCPTKILAGLAEDGHWRVHATPILPLKL